MARCVLVGVIVTYLLAVFQATLGARLSIAGVPPDLLFVWTVCVGLVGGTRAAIITGFASGILEGSLRQSMMAALAISKGVSGLGAGLLSTKLFRENWLVPALAGALLTLVNETVFLIFPGGIRPDAGRLIVGRCLYHAVLTPVVFWLVVRARQALLGLQAEVS